MKFKFCDLTHYSAMNLEGFLNRHDIKFIKDDKTSSDQVERLYDITIMETNIIVSAHSNYVYIGLLFSDQSTFNTKIHITDFSELKIF